MNRTAGQNFADDFSFPVPAELTGMDIWTTFGPGAVATVHIKILLDDGAGNPGAVLTQWDQAPTSWVTNGPGYKVSADFPLAGAGLLVLRRS